MTQNMADSKNKREDPAGLKIVDLMHLDEFTGGDRALIAEVLEIFSENMPGYIRALDSVTDEEWPAAVHKIKGAARTIGAWRMARLAEAIERMPPPDRSSVPYTEVVAQLKASLQEILNYCRSNVFE